MTTVSFSEEVREREVYVAGRKAGVARRSKAGTWALVEAVAVLSGLRGCTFASLAELGAAVMLASKDAAPQRNGEAP